MLATVSSHLWEPAVPCHGNLWFPRWEPSVPTVSIWGLCRCKLFIYLFSILKLGNDIVYGFIAPLSLELRWQFRIISTACQACVCRAHSISTCATLPRAGDDNAFAEVIFAQHRMTPGSAVMGALLHLAQARGLGALQRECDVKQISYTM